MSKPSTPKRNTSPLSFLGTAFNTANNIIQPSSIKPTYGYSCKLNHPGKLNDKEISLHLVDNKVLCKIGSKTETYNLPELSEELTPLILQGNGQLTKDLQDKIINLACRKGYIDPLMEAVSEGKCAEVNELIEKKVSSKSLTNFRSLISLSALRDSSDLLRYIAVQVSNKPAEREMQSLYNEIEKTVYKALIPPRKQQEISIETPSRARKPSTPTMFDEMASTAKGFVEAGSSTLKRVLNPELIDQKALVEYNQAKAKHALAQEEYKTNTLRITKNVDKQDSSNVLTNLANEADKLEASTRNRMEAQHQFDQKNAELRKPTARITDPKIIARNKAILEEIINIDKPQPTAIPSPIPVETTVPIVKKVAQDLILPEFISSIPETTSITSPPLFTLETEIKLKERAQARKIRLAEEERENQRKQQIDKDYQDVDRQYKEFVKNNYSIPYKTQPEAPIIAPPKEEEPIKTKSALGKEIRKDRAKRIAVAGKLLRAGNFTEAKKTLFDTSKRKELRGEQKLLDNLNPSNKESLKNITKTMSNFITKPLEHMSSKISSKLQRNKGGQKSK